jgi:NAD+ kinase
VKIAIYGTEVRSDFLPIYQRIFNFFEQNSIDIVLLKKLKSILNTEFKIETHEFEVFEPGVEFDFPIDFLLSIGGDGTFLSAVPYALLRNIPIVGINCGRLGFLADISSENLEEALTQLVKGDYLIEKRSMLELIKPKNLFEGFDYAINELTVHKLDNSSMIKIETFINGEFLANYWADGLIVGTPTGSTAYSLSVGGPVVMPDLAGLLITPIAPHNLTVRPFVVPDNVEIELRIKGRGNQFLVSFDHHSEPLDFSTHLKIRKAGVMVPIVKLDGQSFYSTLRDKLMWGADRRN